MSSEADNAAPVQEIDQAEFESGHPTAGDAWVSQMYYFNYSVLTNNNDRLNGMSKGARIAQRHALLG